MEYLNEKKEVLYTENTDASGFVIREIPRTENEHMRFQAGYTVSRPELVPEYTPRTVTDSKTGKPVLRAVFTHHSIGGNIPVFHLHGSGSTKEKAITNASNKLIRADIAAGR